MSLRAIELMLIQVSFLLDILVQNIFDGTGKSYRMFTHFFWVSSCFWFSRLRFILWFLSFSFDPNINWTSLSCIWRLVSGDLYSETCIWRPAFEDTKRGVTRVISIHLFLCSHYSVSPFIFHHPKRIVSFLCYASLFSFFDSYKNFWTQDKYSLELLMKLQQQYLLSILFTREVTEWETNYYDLKTAGNTDSS